MSHSKEKNKPMETVLGKDLMAVIVDKDFKATIIKAFRGLKENVGESRQYVNKMEIPVNR